jgi:DNA topoisomerase-3
MNHPEYGEFATKIRKEKLFSGPNNGKLDDKAHPPIHPVRLPGPKDELTVIQRQVYNFIVRHFLACVSKDAVYYETKVTANFSDELFIYKGIRVEEQNFLEIYNRYNFKDTILPDLNEGKAMTASGMKMEESATRPPPLLSESALISLMDENGIGTDATIHEHISKIQLRGYAFKEFNTFRPTPIGLHLLEAYDNLGFELSKPDLRAAMESDMKKIANGEHKNKDESVKIHLDAMREVLKK